MQPEIEREPVKAPAKNGKARLDKNGHPITDKPVERKYDAPGLVRTVVRMGCLLLMAAPLMGCPSEEASEAPEKTDTKTEATEAKAAGETGTKAAAVPETPAVVEVPKADEKAPAPEAK